MCHRSRCQCVIWSMQSSYNPRVRRECQAPGASARPNAQAKGLAGARSDADAPLLERDGPRHAPPSTEGANRRVSQGAAVNLSGKVDSRANSVAACPVAQPHLPRSLVLTAIAAAAAPLRTTPLNALHIELGARMVPFAGYSMPVQYPTGLIAEHLHTRRAAGLFDVSHMGQLRLLG